MKLHGFETVNNELFIDFMKSEETAPCSNSGCSQCAFRIDVLGCLICSIRNLDIGLNDDFEIVRYIRKEFNKQKFKQEEMEL